MSMRLRLILLSASLLLANSVGAQTSKDLALMGRVSWSAFECSSLASVMNEDKDQERLFALGYQQGKAFIDALQKNRIELKDRNEQVPSGFLLLLQGPTPDFVLGRVFESAQENALKDVITPDGITSKDLQATLARSKFTKQNCSLLRAVR